MDERQPGLRVAARADPSANGDPAARRDLSLQHRGDIDGGHFASRLSVDVPMDGCARSRCDLHRGRESEDRRFSGHDPRSLSSLCSEFSNEDWNDLPRLPQEPRRLRGDAGARPAGGARADPRRRRGRRARRQHLRLHRQGEAGVDRHHPRDGRAQEDRRLPDAGRDRLHGGALSRRAARADSGDRRGARDGRGAGDRARRCLRTPGSGSGIVPGSAAIAPQLLRSNGEPRLGRIRIPEPGARSPAPAHLHLRRRHARVCSRRRVTTPT